MALAASLDYARNSGRRGFQPRWNNISVACVAPSGGTAGDSRFAGTACRAPTNCGRLAAGGAFELGTDYRELTTSKWYAWGDSNPFPSLDQVELSKGLCPYGGLCYRTTLLPRKP